MKIKYIPLLALTLALPIVNYGMLGSEKELEAEKVKQNTTQQLTPQIDVVQLKGEIQTKIGQLIELLQTNYSEMAQQKGWTDWKDEQGNQKQGSLFVLLNDIDPSKKIVLKQINQIFTKNVNELTTPIIVLIAQIDSSLNQLPHTMIENKIREYFSQYGNQIEIRDKPQGNGVQFGKIVRLIREGQQLEYYVKTHQLGLLSQTGQSAQSVDLKEPFAYKFLELCGIGPEVHFFYDDDKYFYIATKNEGFSYNGQTEFLTYDKASQELNFYQLNKNLVDKYIVITDFYTRILRLKDIFSQKGNFGFIKQGQHFVDFKLIDFRTHDEKLNDYSLAAIYAGWRLGNNYFSQYSDDLASQIIFSAIISTEPPYNYIIQEDKVLYKRHILKNNLPLRDKIKQNLNTAREFMNEYIANLGLNVIDLNLYLNGVSTNIDLMYDEILGIDKGTMTD